MLPSIPPMLQQTRKILLSLVQYIRIEFSITIRNLQVWQLFKSPTTNEVGRFSRFIKLFSTNVDERAIVKCPLHFDYTKVYNSSKVTFELLRTFFIQRLTLLMERSYIPPCHGAFDRIF